MIQNPNNSLRQKLNEVILLLHVKVDVLTSVKSGGEKDVIMCFTDCVAFMLKQTGQKKPVSHGMCLFNQIKTQKVFSSTSKKERLAFIRPSNIAEREGERERR